MIDMSELIKMQVRAQTETEAFDDLTGKVAEVLGNNENILVYSVLLYLMFITIDGSGEDIKQYLLKATIETLEGVMDA